MYGWRARIGLILPADNAVIEPEFASLRIPGVTFHGFRLTSTDPATMRAQGVELAEALLEMGVDAAVYACAETSFNVEPGVRTGLSDLIEARLGRPVVTATNALLAALRHLGSSRVSLVTPYNAASGKALESTLAENGVEVVSAVHRDFRLESDDPREWFVTNRQESSEAYRMARSVDRRNAELAVIVSTNLPTLDIIERLETDTFKPVITTNQSILWWLSQTLGIAMDQLALGAIMRSERSDGLLRQGR